MLEAMVESEEALREVQSLTRVGNWRLNLRTKQFTCSDELLKIIELAPGESHLTFELFFEMVYGDDRAVVEEAYKKSLDGKESGHVSHRILLRDGRTKFVTQRFTTFCDSQGQPVRSVGTVQDFSGREIAWER